MNWNRTKKSLKNSVAMSTADYSVVSPVEYEYVERKPSGSQSFQYCHLKFRHGPLQGRANESTCEGHLNEASYEALQVKTGKSLQKEASDQQLQEGAAESASESYLTKTIKFQERKMDKSKDEILSKESCFEKLQKTETTYDSVYDTIADYAVCDPVPTDSSARNVNKKMQSVPVNTSKQKLSHKKTAVFVAAAILVIVSVVICVALVGSIGIVTMSETAGGKSAPNNSVNSIMNVSCNGVVKEWRRVAYFDQRNNSNTTCPEGLSFKADPPSCIRPLSSPGCSAVVFDAESVKYSHVCVKVLSVLTGSPDGFVHYSTARSYKTLEDNFVDGIVFTHGANPMKHIWSFAFSSARNTRFQSCSSCDCYRPTFLNAFHFSCFLGSQCVRANLCSQVERNNTFYRELPQPTTDTIEMRVCRDEPRDNEDILIASLDIYIS